MQIITPLLEKKIKSSVINSLTENEFQASLSAVTRILKELYENIPTKKRISYGRVHTIKVLSKNIFNEIRDTTKVKEYSIYLIENGLEECSKGLGIGLLAYYGINHIEEVLPYFLSTAASEHWEIREFTQLFFRKLIKPNKEKVHKFLKNQADSKDPNVRRFVSETMRPVQENKWFYKEPDYSLSIISLLFEESHAYPRTSVGNNLSDLARHLPELVFEIVEKLVDSGNKNSYWIATRACRNLVKKYPLKVFDILKTDIYKYKSAIYYRKDLAE